LFAPNNNVPPLFTAIELPEMALVVLFWSCRIPAFTAEAPEKVFGEDPLTTNVPAPIPAAITSSEIGSDIPKLCRNS